MICTVVVPLNRSCNLEIKTNAKHALEIISGRTILPAKNALVLDLDGQRIAVARLVRLADKQ